MRPVAQKGIDKFSKINILYLLKAGIGSAFAILLAEFLGLAYSPSAGIITLLTIQNTKKETIFIALKRIGAFAIAVIIAFVVFSLFGYTSVAFGGFVFLFVALCILFGLRDGISMNAVLTTHFLIEQRMDIPLLINEVLLLFIGMGIGIMINLIMPNTKTKIKRNQQELEEEMKVTLRGMAKMLETKEHSVDLSKLEQKVEFLLEKAYENAGNTLLADTQYLISYLEMRKLQITVLGEMVEKMNRIPNHLPQVQPVAKFMRLISVSFHERNNVKDLLGELETLYEYFRKAELPKTREEFEHRAMLFHVLKELEEFLMLKRNFVKKINKSNLTSYWK